MLGEPKNKLDEIAEDLVELASQVTLQAARRRAMDKHMAQNGSRGEKRCCSGDDEDQFPQDDQTTFELARAIGRIEGRFLKLLANRIFEYDEDEIQGYTHEQLYKKVQNMYEEIREIQAEFENL